MRETAGELSDLQQLLDRSSERGGGHLRSIFDEGHRVSARELADRLVGIFEMHLATVTSDGAPLVAPIDGILLRGKVWIGLPAGSVRARLVREEPRVSASYIEGTFAFILHGVAIEASDHPHLGQYDSLVRELYVAEYGPRWIDWYERRKREPPSSAGFTGLIEPRVMFAKR